jgi:hypothetical protein
LPRALADPATVAGFHELRREGWLDWHLLIAMHNVAINVRASAAELFRRRGLTEAEHRRLVREPESPESALIPLTALAPDRMRSAMEIAIFAIGGRRWRLSPAPETPNIKAFRQLLEDRYGFSADDVPHRDLLVDALAGDGALLALSGASPAQGGRD